MANISSMKKESKRSPPDHSPSKNKRKCDVKKKQGTKKRKTVEQEESVDKRVICYASKEQKRLAMEKAQKIEKELVASESICCLKIMGKSNVSGGFWLALPAPWCRLNLPTTHNETVILVVEGEEKVWPVIYLTNKTGLSGGWRAFSKDHGLLVNDVLVFQLLQKDPYKFKVHITRAIECLSMMSARMPFRDVKIQVNGLDLKLSKQVETKYNHLCQSQNKILHEDLTKGFDSKKAAGVISETVKIADAIEVATKRRDLNKYRETLERFEGLGMAVGFLSARIDERLGHLAFLETKKKELEVKEHEKRVVEMRLDDVRLSIQNHRDEIRSEHKKFGAVFTKTVRAPWTKFI